MAHPEGHQFPKSQIWTALQQAWPYVTREVNETIDELKAQNAELADDLKSQEALLHKHLLKQGEMYSVCVVELENENRELTTQLETKRSKQDMLSSLCVNGLTFQLELLEADNVLLKSRINELMDHNRKLTMEYELQCSQYHTLRHHLKVLWEQTPPSCPVQDDHPSGEADDLPTPRPDMVRGKKRDPQE